MAPFSKRKNKYSEENLRDAVAAVKTKLLTTRAAADKYGVPQTTIIMDRIKGRYSAKILKAGQRCKLSQQQEKRLVNYLLYKAKIGNGLSRPDIALKVKEIFDSFEKENDEFTEDQRLFPNNLPPRSWVYRFVGRHKELSARTPQHLGHQRQRVTEMGLRKWFDNLSDFLKEEHNIDAKTFLTPENSHRIFNIDETGFPLCGNSKLKIIAEKGAKNVFRVSSESKEQITVVGSVSANGDFQKPLILFPGVRPNCNFRGVDKDKYSCGTTANGWITADSFFFWFTNLIVAPLRDKIEFPILIFMDGHTSHINISISEFCQKNDVILYCFPPHASHIIQPLDISVYSPLKLKWNKALSDFKEEYNENMNKSNFIKVFDRAFEEIKIKPSNVTSGFRKAGLVPFNADAIDYTRVINEEESAKQFKQNNLKCTADQKLGIAMALKCFEKHFSKENLDRFKRRFEEQYDIQEDTLMSETYQVYKSMRLLLEDKFEFDDKNEGGLDYGSLTRLSNNGTSERFGPICIQEDDLECTATTSSGPSRRQHSTNRSITTIMENSLPLAKVPIRNYAKNIISNNIQGSPALQLEVLDDSIRSCMTLEIDGNNRSNADIPSAENVIGHDLSIQGSSTPSKPKYYGNFQFSPFKHYLQIDDKVVISRKHHKVNNKVPSAVSGEEFFKYLEKKQEEKRAEEEQKERRKKEREEKKKQINPSSSKQKKKSGEGSQAQSSRQNNDEESEDNEGNITVEIVYDDDSGEDVLVENANIENECAACGGDEEAHDLCAWMGCSSCSRWFHKVCIDAEYENMTLEQIEQLDFSCNHCQQGRRIKKRR